MEELPVRPVTRRGALRMGLAAPVALPSMARAQGTWPVKPIHVILPYGAGGAADTVCRVLFAKVAERLKQSVVIENRTGGNTIVGSSAVLQMPKDGYAFLVNSAQFLVNPVLMKNLPFDFATSFVPVTRLAAFPQVVAVRSDFPATTIAEFLAYAKANPGRVSYGTPPAAGMGHLAGALLQSKAGIKLNHAPYRLATEAVRDLSGGQIDAVILTTSTIQPALQGNKGRVLAITSARRTPAMPDVPTLTETVLPGFDMDDWVGLFAASGVGAEIIAQMQAALADAARDPAVIARLSPLGTMILADATTSFAKFLDDQREVLTQLIRETGITLE